MILLALTPEKIRNLCANLSTSINSKKKLSKKDKDIAYNLASLIEINDLQNNKSNKMFVKEIIKRVEDFLEACEEKNDEE